MNRRSIIKAALGVIGLGWWPSGRAVASVPRFAWEPSGMTLPGTLSTVLEARVGETRGFVVDHHLGRFEWGASRWAAEGDGITIWTIGRGSTTTLESAKLAAESAMLQAVA